MVRSVPSAAPAVSGSAPMPARSMLWLVALALLGVVSLLASDLDLGPLADQVDLPPGQLRLIVLVQPAILSIVAVLIGWRTSRRTGLRAPLVERGLGAVDPRGLAAAGLVAVVGAAVLGLYVYLASQVFVLEGAEAVSTSLATRLLYGGVTEEVLMRWGLMGFLAWVLIRVARRPTGRTGDLVAIAIVAAAIVFALAHFPALALVPGAAPVHYLLSFVTNVAVGVLYGWTFARHGLEYAMVAHAGTHLLVVLAQTTVA